MHNIKDMVLKASICGILYLSCFNFIHSQENKELFPFKPPVSFKLNPKYVLTHHPVETAYPLAQLYFDQGLSFIYAFNHDAAYWSFLKASEIDPNMPMAYWGMALALGENINMEITSKRLEFAYNAIQRAVQLSSNSPDNEKDYIRALARRYSTSPQADLKQLAHDYNQAMRELSNKYPDDLDAATLFVESILDLNPWNQWSPEGKPLEGTMEAVRRLEAILKRNPDHFGANHYYIHAVEASHYPEMALMAAERLKNLTSNSGHLLHMPSHIYMLVGDYLQAARSNEEAIAADREYIREYGVEGIYPVHYLSHNIFLLSRAYIMLGRFEEAKRAANELVDFYSPHLEHMSDLEYYASAPLIVLLAFQRWKDILDLPKPDSFLHVSTALWHFGRALAFLGLKDIPRALNERQQFLNQVKQVASDKLYGYNKADKFFKIAENSLEAKLAEAQGDFSKAVESYQKAIAEQDTLRYNEPADWFFSMREMFGGFLLRIQKPGEAELVFRDGLKKQPRSGRLLFGLRESLKAQSKVYDAYWVNEEFQKAWMYSPISLNIRDL